VPALNLANVALREENNRLKRQVQTLESQIEGISKLESREQKKREPQKAVLDTS
jgi:hypothetical protein